jgi:hypothetical protein
MVGELVDVSRVWPGLEVQVVLLVENQWAVSSVTDAGTDSDASGVEADLVGVRVSI